LNVLEAFAVMKVCNAGELRRCRRLVDHDTFGPDQLRNEGDSDRLPANFNRRK
jgi:hypothetical protein